MEDEHRSGGLFVFQGAHGEAEDVEDEMEADQEIQDTAGLGEKVPSDEEDDTQ
jgi:hypothetical protein